MATGATIGEAVVAAAGRLAAAGADTPRLDAELLLAEVLDPGRPDRARLIIDRDRPLGPAAAARYRALVARREAREPIAYILGRRDFRRITLRVDRRVLIPRPETELLVEVGLELPSGAVVLDVGTGSGAVALALKDERPDLAVRATDVSDGALAVARENAARLGLEVAFRRADLLDGAPPADAVLANLPYVPAAAELAPEITRYEPSQAVFAGADGLGLVRRLVAQVAARDEVGLVALEIGGDQAVEVVRLLRERERERGRWASVEVLADLAGLDRVVVGRR